MNFPPPFPCRLSVSVVLYHSAPAQLNSALASLVGAIERARDAGLLSRAEILLVDNSCDAEYTREMRNRVSAWAAGWDLPVVYRNRAENLGIALWPQYFFQTLLHVRCECAIHAYSTPSAWNSV